MPAGGESVLERHEVGCVVVGLNWWIGTCRGCGASFLIRMRALPLRFDGAAIRMGRAGVMIWPGRVDLQIAEGAAP